LTVRIAPMPTKLSAPARARKIKLLMFDVDGVLTDGKLFIFPAPAGSEQSVLEQSRKHGGEGGIGFHSQSLIEAKGFHAHDGTSISLARLAGIKTGLITKRISETVALRARDLKLEYVRQGIQDKRTCLEEVVREEGIGLDEVAFVGDDVIDLPAMRASGLAIAVKNARAEVKKEAHYLTPPLAAMARSGMPWSSYSKRKASGKKSWKVTSASVDRQSSRNWAKLAIPNKKPIGCLLGACSGQHPMGYRFSLLTLLFSGVCTRIKLPNSKKFRLIL
jgi:3-deoxy-D-manno-octulosonate 8-phosphate phosphatase (KDO 8-P phosphatase)